MCLFSVISVLSFAEFLSKALLLSVVHLGKEYGNLLEFLFSGARIELGEAVLFGGLLRPAKLAEEVVDLVSVVLCHGLLHEVLPIASLAEHLAGHCTGLLFDLAQPVEDGSLGLADSLLIDGTGLGMHVLNERFFEGLGLEEDLAEASALLGADLDQNVSRVVEGLTEFESFSFDLAKHLAIEPWGHNVVLSDNSRGGGSKENSEFH